MPVLDHHNRREYYRLRYPAREEALLSTERAVYRVAELGAKGLRIVAKGPWPGVGVPLEGTLRLASGRAVNVSGRLLREDGDHWILAQVRGLTPGDVLEEQRRLIRRYPFLR